MTPTTRLEERCGHDQADKNRCRKHEQSIYRVGNPEELHALGQYSSDRDCKRASAPDPFHRLHDDVGYSESEQQFMHMTKDMDFPQEKPLNNSADTKKKRQAPPLEKARNYRSAGGGTRRDKRPTCKKWHAQNSGHSSSRRPTSDRRIQETADQHMSNREGKR